MTGEEISAFLGQASPALVGVVATVRADGSPHAVPVWYSWDGRAVNVWTDAGRVWVRNLSRDPRVAFTVQQSGPPAGNRLTVQTDVGGGSPLRCCLRESAPGERVLLIAYTPPGTRGAYAERGPVFIHAERCGGYPIPGVYPPGLSHRQQVVRAYDRDGRIADVHDGDHAMAVIRELLARPEVTLAHLRNVGYGCYNFAVRRG
jgi:hypothetical protein